MVPKGNKIQPANIGHAPQKVIQGNVIDEEFVDRSKKNRVPSVQTIEDSTKIQMAQISTNPSTKREHKLRDGEDYGVELDQINHQQVTPNVFEDENTRDGRIMVYSSHNTVIGNSQWKTFHTSIKGDFYDPEFDCLNQYARQKGKVDPLFGLKRCVDEYDRNKM